MIGLDTNVFLRYLVVDNNKKQHELVRSFMAGRTADNPAYISHVTLAETVWVLSSRLKYTQEVIMAALANLLDSSDLVFEGQEELSLLVNEESSISVDLADYLIVWAGVRAGCTHTITFDKSAARHIPSMKLFP